MGANLVGGISVFIAAQELETLEYTLGQGEARRHFEARLAPVLVTYCAG